MKIAVVGSGISGLVSAYELSKNHEVHLFESSERIGGHTATYDVETDSGKYAVDTGFIVFNDWTYPNFIKLMAELNVESKPSNMSFSVKSELNSIEYNGSSMAQIFAQKKNLLNYPFIKMLLEIMHFNKTAVTELDHLPQEMTLREYLAKGNYSRFFSSHYIIPMGSAIWSSSVEQMLEFPIKFFVRFFKNHGMLSVNERPTWRVIVGGSRAYLEPITKPFKRNIHLNSKVVSVTREGNKVVLKTEKEDSQIFEHVILATHADQTLEILQDSSILERDILGAFSYQLNETVLHTDVSVLPKNRKAWASWNYLIPRKSMNRVSVTYNMNILQGIQSPETFCVSLNLESQIDQKKIIKKLKYHHPTYSLQAVNAQSRWKEISGKGGIHFTGAYWGYGFHEDGVKSAIKVIEAIRKC